MNFDEFVLRVKEEIRDYLPDDFRDAEISVSETKKINRNYTGLLIRKPGHAAAVSIDLDGIHETAEERPFEDVMRAIADRAATVPPAFEYSELSDYELVKDKLFIRVCDAESNKDVLEKAPHRVIAGLAVTSHLLMETADGEFQCSAMVDNRLLEKYGITAEQLLDDSISNSQKIIPPVIRSMESMMEEIFNSMGNKEHFPTAPGYDPEDFDLNSTMMAVLSNKDAVNGASVMFYRGVLEKIGEKCGKGFFILPSSLHEVLLVPDNGELDAEELFRMVREVNLVELDPKDKLCDAVFYYSTDKVFSRVTG